MKTQQTNLTAELNWQGASLWASAFVMGALILSAAGQRAGNAALADMAVDGQEYGLVTTSGGNSEVLYVLHKTKGRIFVYEASPNTGLNLVNFQDIGEQIEQAQKEPNQ
jgi:hypothetical protein